MKNQLVMLRRKANRKNAKRVLSIHEISPEWARLLGRLPKTDQNEYYIRGKKLDISDCKYCVVGEAHGFDDSYQDWNSKNHCYDCFSHAVNFGHSLLDNPERRELLLDNFVNHWNESHV